MKAIVTTTINPPTKALKKFINIARKDDWQLYIVGDRKTPHAEYLQIAAVIDCVHYLHPDDQEVIGQKLSDLIGWNCIQRRNFGLLAAYRDGAEIIATIDDDNIPYENWGQNCLVNTEDNVRVFRTNEPVWDPLCPYFGEIWHRGFPVQMLSQRIVNQPYIEKRDILVQADLWDGNPDIDAICRIAIKPTVTFPTEIIPYGSNVLMPFNSQNTFLSRDVFPTYFLFPHVGRMDDIWAAYVTQFQFPESVVFSKASVYQERNPHDLVLDLQAEMLGYSHNQEFVKSPKDWQKFLPSRALEAYDVYKELLSN